MIFNKKDDSKRPLEEVFREYTTIVDEVNSKESELLELRKKQSDWEFINFGFRFRTEWTPPPIVLIKLMMWVKKNL